MEVLILVIFFLAIVMVGVSFEINKSIFKNFLYLLIGSVSFFAVIKTQGFTFYLISLVSFVGFFVLKFRDISFRFSNSLSDLGCSILILFLFLAIFLDFETFEILHPGFSLDDISVYSRIAYYNNTEGVENTQGVYNLFNSSPSIEFYHHFELWLSSLGVKLNNANYSVNLLLFAFPLITFLSFLGLKDLFGLSQIKSLVIIILFLVVMWPYDLLNDYLNLSLPKGGGGAIILGTKNVMILPILLSLIYELKTKSNHFYLTGISLFLYPLLIPLVSVSILIYSLFFSKSPLKFLWMHGFLVLVVIGFYIGVPNSHPGLDLKSGVDLRYIAKVIYVSVGTSLISFGVYWFFLLNHIGVSKLKPFLVFFSIAGVLSMVFWILFSRNIDSNQLFRNFFTPLFSLSIACGVVYFYSQKMHCHALAGAMIFVLPIFSVLGYSKMNKPSEELIKIAHILEKGDKILFFPNPKVINSVFMYNERMFLPMDISMIHTLVEVDILNTVSLLDTHSLERNATSTEMLGYYKRLSPVYNACGSIEDKIGCLFSFSKQYGFHKALIHVNSPFASGFHLESKLGDFYLINF